MFLLFDLLSTFIFYFLSLLRGPSSAEPFVLNVDGMQKIRLALDHSQMVFWDDVEMRLSDVRLFETNLDRALVRYLDESCYVSFRGSSGNVLDNLQSAPGLFPRQVCGQAGCCFVERGLGGAYYASFASELETELQECTERCEGDHGCDVVLTGYSQGGAVASVAAIVLAKYNPTLITFAQQPVTWFACNVLDNMEERYLRFTALCEEGGKPTYDAIPYYGNPLVSRHSGTMIMLGNGAAATIGYNSRRTFLPISGACHDLEGEYEKSVDNLEIGPLDGFPSSALCTADVECKSRRCHQSRCG